MEQYEFFKLFHNIPLADYHLLTAALHSKSFKKGEFITMPGAGATGIVFCEEGRADVLLRNRQQDTCHRIHLSPELVRHPRIIFIPTAF